MPNIEQLQEDNQALTTTAGFGATETISATTDIAVASAAAQAKAMVESRYIMAMRNPRNWDDVRQRLMKECRRPSFANNKSSLYRKPIGKVGVEGLGIRFVEVALRCMTNVFIETPAVYDDGNKEIIRVTLTDLESNLTRSQDVRVIKTVERSKPMEDGSYISVRKNSYGQNTYTIPATDDDIINKRGALISKAVRALGLSLIPGDLQDEAEQVIREIRLNEAAQDPDAERKKIADAFAELGVQPSDLEKYLGHGLGACAPADLVNLRGLYGAIRDGEATWKTVIENADKTQSKPARSKPAKPETPIEQKEPNKWPVWDADSDCWRDSSYDAYDSSIHASPMGTNKDGTFRKRRTRKASPTVKPDAKTQPDAVGKAPSGKDNGGMGDTAPNRDAEEEEMTAALEGREYEPTPWEE